MFDILLYFCSVAFICTILFALEKIESFDHSLKYDPLALGKTHQYKVLSYSVSWRRVINNSESSGLLPHHIIVVLNEENVLFDFLFLKRQKVRSFDFPIKEVAEDCFRNIISRFTRRANSLIIVDIDIPTSTTKSKYKDEVSLSMFFLLSLFRDKSQTWVPDFSFSISCPSRFSLVYICVSYACKLPFVFLWSPLQILMIFYFFFISKRVFNLTLSNSFSKFDCENIIATFAGEECHGRYFLYEYTKLL